MDLAGLQYKVRPLFGSTYYYLNRQICDGPGYYLSSLGETSMLRYSYQASQEKVGLRPWIITGKCGQLTD